MSVIELGIGMVVLTTGALGLLTLALVAITTNARNKLDSSATMIAHTLMEQMVAKSSRSNAGSTFVMTDCRATEAGGSQSWTIETASAAAPGAGATLNSSTGGVDFTQSYSAVPFNYKMRYVACGPMGRQDTYDVRWNVQDVSNLTRMITISVRPLGASSGRAAYAPPVTLRSMAGF